MRNKQSDDTLSHQRKLVETLHALNAHFPVPTSSEFLLSLIEELQERRAAEKP